MSGKKKILIVDDSTIITKLINNYLTGYDIEICGIAGDGKMALEIFKEKLPDLVTLDITMPEIDGLTVLDEMLKIKEDTKIIVISALSDRATAIKALTNGARGFINKPFTEEDIREKLDELKVV